MTSLWKVRKLVRQAANLAERAPAPRGGPSVPRRSARDAWWRTCVRLLPASACTDAGALRATLLATARSWLEDEPGVGAFALRARGDLLDTLGRELAHVLHGVPAAIDGSGLADAPVALRCAWTVARRWRRQVRLLLSRVAEDGPLLHAWLPVATWGAACAGGACAGPERPAAGPGAGLAIASIDTGLSDPHRDGATVLRLHDVHGRRWMYKPRSVALDASWSQAAQRLRAHGVPLARQPRCLERAGYGWVEHCESSPCSTGDQLLAYAEASGATLGLAWLLGASDLHDGNLLANPEGPILLDLETLLQPDRLPVTSPGDGAAALLLRDCVLRTGLLPRLEFDAEGRPADAGALGGLLGGRSNADYDFEPTADARSAAAGPLPGAAQLSDRVCRGFARLVEAVRTQPGLLTGASDAAWQGHPVRVVLRDTRLYLRLLRDSLQPAALRSGLARSRTFAPLASAAQVAPIPDRVVAQETAALEVLDVPVLHGVSDATSLLGTDAAGVPDFFARSGWAGVQDRLARLQAPGAAALQLALVRASFAARGAELAMLDPGAAAAPVDGAHAVRAESPAVPSGAPAWEAAQVERVLRSIIASLRDQAVTIAGGVTWAAPLRRAGRWTPGLLEADAGQGVWGVAWFLAAAARQLRMPPAAALGSSALRIAAPVQSGNDPFGLLSLPPVARAQAARVLHGTGRALDEPWLSQAACVALAPGPADARLAQARAGSEGAAHVVLARIDLGIAFDATQWRAALESALEADLREDAAARALRLAWCAAAMAALAATPATPASLPDAASDPLPVREADAVAACAEAWALDAAGAARTAHALAQASLDASCAQEEAPAALQLAWLRLCAAHPHAAVSARVRTALYADLARGIPLLDDMQGGTLCLVDRLQAAAVALDWPEALNEARKLAAAMLARAEARGEFALLPGPSCGALVPGLDTGLAGVGLGLLRLLDPQSLPSWRAGQPGQPFLSSRVS